MELKIMKIAWGQRSLDDQFVDSIQWKRKKAEFLKLNYTL